MNRLLKGAMWSLAAYAGVQGVRRLARPLASPPPGLVDALDLAPGMKVLAIAPGPIDAHLPVAEAIGASGHLTILVAGDERAEQLTHDVRALGYENIAVCAGDFGAWPCPDGSIDRVLMTTGVCTKAQCLQAMNEAFRVLRPYGKLIVAGAMPAGDFVPERRMLDRALEAGFVLQARRGGSWRYTLVLERLPFLPHRQIRRETPHLETYG